MKRREIQQWRVGKSDKVQLWTFFNYYPNRSPKRLRKHKKTLIRDSNRLIQVEVYSLTATPVSLVRISWLNIPCILLVKM